MINKMALWITKNTKKVIAIALIMLIPALLGMIFTPVNYDILSYLPDSLDSVKGITILDKDFNMASMGIIVLDDVSFDEAKTIENSIEEIEGVKTVLWVGAISESPVPLSMLPSGITSMIYSADGDSTLMMVQFSTPGSSSATLKAIGKIQDILPDGCIMSGTAAMTYDMSQLMMEQVPFYAAIAVGLALIALGMTMESFMLPIVMLMALGISILYNMGTNFMFGQVSFITQSIAAVLQLGVTMDYSIFLMDRYIEEKPKYRTREAAMSKAIVETFASLMGSSLTTVFGFLALCFMSFTLGLDMGIVMAKGVIMGIFTVVTVLPALLLVFEKAINKSRHKSLIPPFGGLNKVTIKLRKFIAVLFVILIIPAWYGQNNVKKYYNMMDAMPDTMESIAAMDVLKNDFNMASMNIVLIDSDIADTKKIELAKELSEIEGVTAVLNLNSMLGTTISADIPPDSIRSMLSTGGKELMMVNSIYSPATDECNAQLDTITEIVKSYDKNGYITGEAPMYKDLISVTDKDFIVTNIISIAAIFIVIAIIFKSISIPLILVLSIEFAIWINIAISFLTGEEICFITPTVISCVQLGATVDYAILLTTRFREEIQNGTEKKQAMRIAADTSHRSIFQSALVFFAATIGVGLVCDIDIVTSMCTMLARGAIISALVIILFLPPVLVVCEGFINKTSYKWREKKAVAESENFIVDEPETVTEEPEKKKCRGRKGKKTISADNSNSPFENPAPIVTKPDYKEIPDNRLTEPDVITEASHSDVNTLFRPGDRRSVQTQKNTIAKVRSSPSSLKGQLPDHESAEKMIEDLTKRYLDNDSKEE
ncbi:MAG: MMPL family transporter [Clostridia bacterium]|nr:MMPL family transporter [Clostridia bacterium]